MSFLHPLLEVDRDTRILIRVIAVIDESLKRHCLYSGGPGVVISNDRDTPFQMIGTYPASARAAFCARTGMVKTASLMNVCSPSIQAIGNGLISTISADCQTTRKKFRADGRKG